MATSLESRGLGSDLKSSVFGRPDLTTRVSEN